MSTDLPTAICPYCFRLKQECICSQAEELQRLRAENEKLKQDVKDAEAYDSDEAQSLRAENTALRAELLDLHEAHEGQGAQLRKANVAIATLQADALRYRWLRDSKDTRAGQLAACRLVWDGYHFALWSDELDAAIDAAMKEPAK